MSPPKQPLAQSIAAFLATSRVYLQLPGRRPRHAPSSAWGRKLRRLALIAGSIGSLFGNVAYADDQYDMEAQARQGDEGRKLLNSPARDALAAKSSLERMP